MGNGLDFLDPALVQNADPNPSRVEATGRAKTNGFAAGAQCRRSKPDEPVAAEEVAGCERIPVISPLNADLDRIRGQVRAIAPDERGGFWAAVFGGGERSPGTFSLHRYTDRAQAPVFSEVADPTAGGARITALGAGADGTVWLGDENGFVYRYDRLAGWSSMTLRGYGREAYGQDTEIGHLDITCSAQ